jgi:hypothetical protein
VASALLRVRGAPLKQEPQRVGLQHQPCLAVGAERRPCAARVHAFHFAARRRRGHADVRTRLRRRGGLLQLVQGLEDEPLRHALTDTALATCGVRVFPRALHSHEWTLRYLGINVGRGGGSRPDGLGKRRIKSPLQLDHVGGHRCLGVRTRQRDGKWHSRRCDTPGLCASGLEMLGKQRERWRCPQQQLHASRHAFFGKVVPMRLALIDFSHDSQRQARTLTNRAGCGLRTLHL